MCSNWRDSCITKAQIKTNWLLYLQFTIQMEWKSAPCDRDWGKGGGEQARKWLHHPALRLSERVIQSAPLLPPCSQYTTPPHRLPPVTRGVTGKSPCAPWLLTPLLVGTVHPIFSLSILPFPFSLAFVPTPVWLLHEYSVHFTEQCNSWCSRANSSHQPMNKISTAQCNHCPSAHLPYTYKFSLPREVGSVIRSRYNGLNSTTYKVLIPILQPKSVPPRAVPGWYNETGMINNSYLQHRYHPHYPAADGHRSSNPSVTWM